MDDCVVEAASPSMSSSPRAVVPGTFLCPDGATSTLSFSDTPSCHFIISKSGLLGKAVFGKTLGNSLPSPRCTISKLLTAFCNNGTCSAGPSSSCTVCHLTKPCGVKAGIDGGTYGS